MVTVFMHTAAELGPTLLLFLAIENFFIFFKQNLSDSLGGALLVLSLISFHAVFCTQCSLFCTTLRCFVLVSNVLVWDCVRHSILFYSKHFKGHIPYQM